MGERSEVYFDLNGRELRRDWERERRRGEEGRDREACFDLVFPVMFIIPDGSEVTGSAVEVRVAIRNWYAVIPDSRELPALQYPADIVFEDGTTLTLNGNEEMRAAYGNCGEGSDFDCPDLLANIGDPCYHADRTEGTMKADCDCK